jgi:hypothetical protein
MARWRLRLESVSGREMLVSIVARLPREIDLYDLWIDVQKEGGRMRGALVHTNRELPPRLTAVLDWILRKRKRLRAVPANELDQIAL